MSERTFSPPYTTFVGHIEAYYFHEDLTEPYVKDNFFGILMSPNYPFPSPTKYNTSRYGSYSGGHAQFTLTVTADIPDQCEFIIQDENGSIYYNITNQTVAETNVTFNGTSFKIVFITYNASVEWTGFLVKVNGFNLNSTQTITVLHQKGSPLKDGLIIGFSTLALIIVLILIGIFTWYQLKKRYQKFDQLCNVLKEMNLSPEEISEMKEKSDELLISPPKLHINFDKVIVERDSSTTYKAFLMGTAPLHLIQRSILTQRFVDCDVVVKVATRFGSDEVDQLFKDFSLCCFVDENSVQENSAQVLPLKWTALESFVQKIFSEKSDVWSYGVLAYEMFSFGKVPYDGVNDDDLVEYLQDGNRLERTPNLFDALYEIMMACWHDEPESRPTFGELEKKFYDFIEGNSALYGYTETTVYNILS
uniref:Protein kinase domain-containing protein n=1 Tax=Acrobeloides nanus TaxID=290746 RepID=A0A914BVI1_9BILA